VAAQPLSATVWLAALQNRYPVEWLRFSVPDELGNCQVHDASLFSSIAENLLQNIADKRHTQPRVRAWVRLLTVADRAIMEVGDDGTAIPAHIARTLLQQHVAAESGLGIGLYQSARLAEQAGYQLQLAENHEGCVLFRLAPRCAGGEA
jgi:C4-dicarboxylate-specific signal transduction histidine kinase